MNPLTKLLTIGHNKLGITVYGHGKIQNFTILKMNNDFMWITWGSEDTIFLFKLNDIHSIFWDKDSYNAEDKSIKIVEDSFNILGE